MNDAIIARIRTWWPIFLGHVAAYLVTWLGGKVGIHVDSLVATEALSAVLSIGIWELGRKLEGVDDLPVVNAIGAWLLALGAAVGPPTYSQPAPAKDAAPPA